MSGHVCRHWIGRENRHCDGTEDVGFFLTGWRCPLHTPSALAGEPEPGRNRYCAPKRCLCGDCPWWRPYNAYAANADSWTTDARAIASGKRRASPQEQAAAKATVAEQKAREQRARKGAA
jgi:hypothetical protein